MNALPILLVIAAGAALVVQNTVMTRLTEQVSTLVIALVLNSAVGLVLLTSILVARTGLSGLSEIFTSFKPWYILPGILGSFFVFASLMGYQKLGAATTISLLVASQLVFGLAMDAWRGGHGADHSYLPSVIGVVCLVVGAYLIAANRG